MAGTEVSAAAREEGWLQAKHAQLRVNTIKGCSIIVSI